MKFFFMGDDFMKFGEKLREQRKKRNLLQTEVAAAIGVSSRTLINYEQGASYPNDRSVYYKLADYFEVDVNYFLTEDEEFLTEAAEKYGKRGLTQAQSVLEQAAALFAGGELSPEDEIAFLHEIQGLFLDSKRRAKDKYTPNIFKEGNNTNSE
jgi:transcriptional regulator with XRE-family HTH domain